MEAVSPRRPRLAWLVTLAATAASTYALDAVATAARVLLVASGALGAAGHTAVLAFLAASYVAWGLGLRANLGANRRLLAHTGTTLFHNAFERWIEDKKKRDLAHHLQEALAELRLLTAETGIGRRRGKTSSKGWAKSSDRRRRDP